MKTFRRDKRFEIVDIDLWELVKCVTALRVNFSSTIIRKFGVFFRQFQVALGKKVTFFGINDDDDDDDDDDDNNNNNNNNNNQQMQTTSTL